MNYIEVRLTIVPQQPWEEIISQELADIGFDSFVEEDTILFAYCSEAAFDTNAFNALLNYYKTKTISLAYDKKNIPSQNWNAPWESDYPIVTVGKKLCIRAPFHPEDASFEHCLEIQPQMSFGTGHHQTTFLLCKTILNIDFKQKNVLDVGTGTGVLGILASKLGAKSVLGTDIEKSVVTNAKENCNRNHISNFSIIKGDIDCVPSTASYDIIFANINRNVLIRHLPHYAHLIHTKGVLLLSGFFETDVKKLVDVANSFNFILNDTYVKETWCVLKFQKQK